MSLDGTYGFVYCGAVDLGIGAFIVDNGTVRGRDYGGLSYSGTVQENADGSITTKVTYHVPAGAVLVQGVSPQDVPYDKIIADLPANVRRRRGGHVGFSAGSGYG